MYKLKWEFVQNRKKNNEDMWQTFWNLTISKMNLYNMRTTSLQVRNIFRSLPWAWPHTLCFSVCIHYTKASVLWAGVFNMQLYETWGELTSTVGLCLRSGARQNWSGIWLTDGSLDEYHVHVHGFWIWEFGHFPFVNVECMRVAAAAGKPTSHGPLISQLMSKIPMGRSGQIIAHPNTKTDFS